MIHTFGPLNWYFSQKLHGHITIAHRTVCPLYAGVFRAVGLFFLPGAARLFLSLLTEVPVNPREDDDGEGKDRGVD